MKYTSYNSLDEMFEGLGSAMKAADSRVKPWQEQVKPGDFYVQDTEYGFKIYGEVLKTDEEPIYKQAHMKHYRLAKAYSNACPEGEVGDVHVSSIEKILSKEEFEEARDNYWGEDDA